MKKYLNELQDQLRKMGLVKESSMISALFIKTAGITFENEEEFPELEIERCNDIFMMISEAAKLSSAWVPMSIIFGHDCKASWINNNQEVRDIIRLRIENCILYTTEPAFRDISNRIRSSFQDFSQITARNTNEFVCENFKKVDDELHGSDNLAKFIKLKDASLFYNEKHVVYSFDLVFDIVEMGTDSDPTLADEALNMYLKSKFENSEPFSLRNEQDVVFELKSQDMLKLHRKTKFISVLMKTHNSYRTDTVDSARYYVQHQIFDEYPKLMSYIELSTPDLPWVYLDLIIPKEIVDKVANEIMAKASEGQRVDWRPEETMPEDYY
jgi:hypothetical protein